MATKRVIDVLEALEHDSDESDVEIEYSDSECGEEVVEESEHDSESEQEGSLSDENNESDADEDLEERIFLRSQELKGKKLPFGPMCGVAPETLYQKNLVHLVLQKNVKLL